MNVKTLGLGIAISGMLMTVGVKEADACGVGVDKFTVNTSVLNVRQSPTTKSKIVGKVKQGQNFIPYDAASNGQWGKIKLSNGKIGWISMKYMKLNCNSCNPDIKNEMYEAVTVTNLNVRKDATASSNRITTLKKGASVSVIRKTKSGWAYIEYANKRFGFVSAKYIKAI